MEVLAPDDLIAFSLRPLFNLRRRLVAVVRREDRRRHFRAFRRDAFGFELDEGLHLPSVALPVQAGVILCGQISEESWIVTGALRAVRTGEAVFAQAGVIQFEGRLRQIE